MRLIMTVDRHLKAARGVGGYVVQSHSPENHFKMI